MPEIAFGKIARLVTALRWRLKDFRMQPRSYRFNPNKKMLIENRLEPLWHGSTLAKQYERQTIVTMLTRTSDKVHR
jgi:hypothetical protein